MPDVSKQQQGSGVSKFPAASIAGLGIPILPEEKAVYFNGFAIALTGGDMVLTLMRNGVPSLTLNASFTVAKTYGESIVAAIKKLEEITNHPIMTVQDVTAPSAGAQTNAPGP